MPKLILCQSFLLFLNLNLFFKLLLSSQCQHHCHPKLSPQMDHPQTSSQLINIYSLGSCNLQILQWPLFPPPFLGDSKTDIPGKGVNRFCDPTTTSQFGILFIKLYNMAPTKQKYFPKKIGLKLCIKLVFFFWLQILEVV